jgi:transcription elongation GreA/GreB family factor
MFVTRAAIRKAAVKLYDITEREHPALRRALADSARIVEGDGGERFPLLEEVGQLRTREAELRAFLFLAQALPPGSTQEVGIGSKATFVDLETHEERTLTIVGADGDPLGGTITIGAPVAQALLGHCVGDVVEVPTVDQRRVQRLQIKGIEEGDPWSS